MSPMEKVFKSLDDDGHREMVAEDLREPLLRMLGEYCASDAASRSFEDFVTRCKAEVHPGIDVRSLEAVAKRLRGGDRDTWLEVLEAAYVMPETFPALKAASPFKNVVIVTVATEGNVGIMGGECDRLQELLAEGPVRFQKIVERNEIDGIYRTYAVTSVP